MWLLFAGLQQEAQLLKGVMKMLVQFEEVTNNLPLRMQLLTACLQFLQPCWIKAASLCSKDSLQVWVLLLPVVLHLYMTPLTELWSKSTGSRSSAAWYRAEVCCLTCLMERL